MQNIVSFSLLSLNKDYLENVGGGGGWRYQISIYLAKWIPDLALESQLCRIRIVFGCYAETSVVDLNPHGSDLI
jgi:hypothetical protein